MLNYQYIDDFPLNGTNYYRLRQVDFDGSFSFSAIQSIEHEITEALDLKLYPNPIRANDPLKLEIAGLGKEDGLLIIFTTQGEPVFQQTINPEQRSLSLRLPRLSSGIYLIRMQNKENKAVTKRLVVR